MNKKTLLLCLVCLVLPAQATTYYIAYTGGADANAGTSTNAPWKCHPKQTGWTGGAHTLLATNRYIFKGGDVWPNAAGTLYTTTSGSATNYMYFGIDTNWFIGASWTRPKFDAQGTNIVDSRNIIGSSGGTRNNMIVTKGSYLFFDSIEVTGWNINTTAAGYGYGVYAYSGSSCIFSNMYAHDWVMKQGLGGDYGGFYGGSLASGMQAINCTVKGPTSHDTNYVTLRTDYPTMLDTGQGIEAFSVVRGCDISHTVQGTWNCGTVEDSNIHDGGNPVDPASHGNAVNAYGIKITRRNKIHDWGLIHPGESTILYMVPGWSGSATNEAYDNVLWNVGKVAIETSESNNSSSYTTALRIFNNTIYRSGNCIYVSDRSGNAPINYIDVRGNLLISDSANAYLQDSWSWTGHTTAEATPTIVTNANRVISLATAAANNLTSTNYFKPSATVSGVTTNGVNLSAYFTTDHENASRPADPGLWDAGAYQLNGTAPTAPDAPSGLAATGLDSTISLTWEATYGASSYVLYRSTNNSTYAALSTNTLTGSVDSTIALATTYYYKILARNSAGDSPLSSSVSATATGVAAPSAPTNLAAALTGNGANITLTWTASAGATSYTVYRLDSGGVDFVSLGSTASTTLADTSLTVGENSYQVTASNSGGTSDPAAVSLTTYAPVVTSGNVRFSGSIRFQ